MFTFITWLWIGIGLATLLVLVTSKIRAPYGRHTREGWGRLIPNNWGWFIMEMPALLLMPLLAVLGPVQLTMTTWLLVSLWVLHYAHRTLVFPFLIRTKGKKMPLSIVFSALAFNVINGGLNGYYLGFVYHSANDSLNTIGFIGLLVFFIGMIINWRSDYYLIGLRKDNVGYQIPKGGLFKLVSCPNHLGEIVEWSGFALLAWNLPALSFAIWTVSNLLPRALNHHAWYKEHFTNYPKERKAVIPFIL